MQNPSLNPKYIQQKDDGWYFIDETWNEVGPFKTRKLAAKALETHVLYLENREAY